MNRRGQIGMLGARLALSASGMPLPPAAQEQLETDRKVEEHLQQLRALGIDFERFEGETVQSVTDRIVRQILGEERPVGDEVAKLLVLMESEKRALTRQHMLDQAGRAVFENTRRPIRSNIFVTPPGGVLLSTREPAPQEKKRSLAERKARRAKRKQRRQR